MLRKLSRKGFTLIEVLLVVVIIAILAGIVIIAVNPGRQVSQTNNTARSADVQSLLNAIGQYQTENRGAVPAGITDAALNISTTGANICALLVPTYFAALPVDPTVTDATYTNCTTAYDTGYTVKNADGRITVAAPGAELSETISVTR